MYDSEEKTLTVLTGNAGALKANIPLQEDVILGWSEDGQPLWFIFKNVADQALRQSYGDPNTAGH
jgi:hypothetical protein